TFAAHSLAKLLQRYFERDPFLEHRRELLIKECEFVVIHNRRIDRLAKELDWIAGETSRAKNPQSSSAAYQQPKRKYGATAKNVGPNVCNSIFAFIAPLR